MHDHTPTGPTEHPHHVRLPTTQADVARIDAMIDRIARANQDAGVPPGTISRSSIALWLVRVALDIKEAELQGLAVLAREAMVRGTDHG